MNMCRRSSLRRLPKDLILWEDTAIGEGQREDGIEQLGLRGSLGEGGGL